MFVLGRLNAIRALVRRLYQAPDLNIYLEEFSLFGELDINLAVASLKQDGYFLGLKLPSHILQEISSFAYSNKIEARNCPDINFVYTDKNKAIKKNINNAFVHGTYPDVRSRVHALKMLENDPKLRKIAAIYLNCNPVHIRTDLSWLFVAEQSLYEKVGDAQLLFHYDLNDYHSLKFFFYITDVDLTSGPHVCIRKSHKTKKIIHQLSWLRGHYDRELIDCYGAENLVNICGQAGFGFVEDTFCFHRGSPPTSRDRLMLQIEFAAHNYGMWIR